jgi:hypothetical protein
MKPTLPEAEKKLVKDIQTFEQLPAKTRELEVLQEQAEKTTGTENAALHQTIRDKTAESISCMLIDAGDNPINLKRRIPVEANKCPKE